MGSSDATFESGARRLAAWVRQSCGNLGKQAASRKPQAASRKCKPIMADLSLDKATVQAIVAKKATMQLAA